MGTGRIAIIPARGGSKRLPRKNIIDFLGRPIIAYTIDAARESACFDTVVVSTEDEEIASIAAAFDVRVDRRTPELATDAARVVDVCIDLLERERCAGRQWSSFACLYATAPMRTAADIRATVGLLDPGRCEFAMAVTRYSSPQHQALKVSGRGELDPMWPDLIDRRESELLPLVVDNGSTYAVTA
ncbi:MAG TPA: acylneuraminate cytidylyltransferase family protein, partial [Burkholderiales bacterium]|nr:acylneuraminate cytidylyltransferase family protein [Burkholderiales bacterium]